MQQTGDRLADRAYALIVENGFNKHDRFPLLDASWPTVAPAIPVFLAGPNERLQTVCEALARFLNFTGRWDERLSLSQEAEDKAVANKDYLNAGLRAYNSGWVHYLRDQEDKVISFAERAEKHWKKAKAGPHERGLAIRLRGNGYQLAKNYPAAIEAYREAVQVWRTQSPESVDVSVGLDALAEAEQLSGDLVAAERDYRESLRIAKAVGNAEGVAGSTGHLASVALELNNWSCAEKLAREALTLADNLGRRELIAENCRRLATALTRQGRQAEGLPYAQRAVEIYTALRSPDLKDAREALVECEN